MTNTYPHTDAVYTEAMDKLRDCLLYTSYTMNISKRVDNS